MEFDLGARIRAVRKMHGLSQRRLAERAGVTNGTISLIEKNKISPSVGSLKKVLDGIPMSFADFFSIDLVSKGRVFFAADELVELAGGSVSYRQVGRDMTRRTVQILHEHYAPGADTGEIMLRHDAEEGGVIVRGQLEVIVGDQRRVLGSGEAYYFDSRAPHRFRNPGEEDCEVVSACSPPSF